MFEITTGQKDIQGVAIGHSAALLRTGDNLYIRLGRYVFGQSNGVFHCRRILESRGFTIQQRSQTVTGFEFVWRQPCGLTGGFNRPIQLRLGRGAARQFVGLRQDRQQVGVRCSGLDVLLQFSAEGVDLFGVVSGRQNLMAVSDGQGRSLVVGILDGLIQFFQ